MLQQATTQRARVESPATAVWPRTNSTRPTLTPAQVLDLMETIGTSAATLLEFLRQDHADHRSAIDMARLAVAAIGALADEAIDLQMVGTTADWFSGPRFRDIGREAHG